MHTNMATNNSGTYLSCTARKIDNLWDLQPGDHIRTRGEMGEFIDSCIPELSIYDHHMLVVRVVSNSKIQIIHKSKSQRGVEEMTIAYQASDIEVLDYECSYTGVKAIQRARERMNQKYSLMFDNCEHFVTEIKTGKKQSIQVQTGVKMGAVAAVGVGLVAAFALGGALAYNMFGGKSSKECDSDSDDEEKGKRPSYKHYYQ